MTCRLLSKRRILYSLCIICVLFLLVNLYLLLSMQTAQIQTSGTRRFRSQSSARHETTERLPPTVTKDDGDGGERRALRELAETLSQQVNWTLCAAGCSADAHWDRPRTWVTARQVHGEKTYLGRVLQRMATEKIVRAGITGKGTQMKVLLHLRGGQKVLFKPQRYSRDHVIEGDPYAGADRHNGEIAAFHVNRLLNFRRSPLVIGRRINVVEDIMPVAEPRLLKTFLTLNNATCFFGVCHYCTISDPVCADSAGILEGSVALWLPSSLKLKQYRHPWSRTYREGIKALWETHTEFCKLIKSNPTYSEVRLLDLIDAAVFDFLIGNADRHRYEVFDEVDNSVVLLLDNGKSFGNPFYHETSILAPLYQCCMLRESTWKRIKLFDGDVFGTILKRLMSSDPIAPILTDQHLNAMNQRIAIVKETVDRCFQLKQENPIVIRK